MSTVPFQSFSPRVDMVSSPIVPSWIKAGNPTARVSVLSRSADRTMTTVIWDCTAGKFEWIYDCDETVHIVEGSIVLTDEGNAAKRLGPGDIVFFPKGAKVHWEVEGYVRKVAVLRKVLPNPLTGVYNVLRRVKRIVKGAGAPDPMAGLSGESVLRPSGAFQSSPAGI